MAEVVFRKQVSDGNYGSEIAEVHLDVDVELLHGSALSDVDKAMEDAVAAALATARRLVHDELRHSPSWSVQRALEYPNRVEESAELELAVGKRQSYSEDLPFDDDEGPS